MQNEIVIKGACEHNLKNIDLTLPRNKLIVITGLSGSGKSSLAFDTQIAISIPADSFESKGSTREGLEDICRYGGKA